MRNKHVQRKSKVRFKDKTRWGKVWFITKIVIVSLLALGVTVSLVMYMIARPLVKECRQEAFDKLNDITENTFTRMENTEIYDKDDNLIASINVSNYKYAPIGDVSDYIIDGYIAVEDRRFLEHNGIDLKAIARAGVSLIKNKGHITQGGSTITQQVCKNIFLSQEKSFKRKLVEFYMAPEIEKKYSKNDIMEFYVNSNFYAYNCYGVESAAQYYFGKSAKTVSLAEAATIIGISNNPSAYNPVDNPDKSLEKRKIVLGQMLDYGCISQEQYDTACNEEIKLVLKRDKRDKESYQTSYAVRCAALEQMKRDNFEFKYVFDNKEDYESYNKMYLEEISKQETRVRSGGFKIYTSFDPVHQDILQNAVNEVLKSNKEWDNDLGKFKFQGGAVSIDNRTGLVDAIVGGRGTEDEFNRGFLAVRQPGSAIKPVIDYGPAFDTGRYYPSYQVEDSAIKNGPANWYSGYRGKMSVREALARSVNTTAYKTLLDVGPRTGLEYLGKMRFDTLTDTDNVGAIALGGFTYGVRVADMARAYYTIANKGVYTDASCIRRIDYQNKGTIYDVENDVRKQQVYTADSAYMLTSCLQGVVERPEGTAHVGKLNGVVSACKTGTTDDKKDGWFCGFTPYYTCAVWVGYDSPKSKSDLGGATYPGPIWQRYMSTVHQDLEPINEFDRPETIVDCFIDNNGNRTDRDTGRTDIFSSIAEKELRKTEEERQREIWTAQEQANAQDENKRIGAAESAIKIFEDTPCDSVDNLNLLDRKYKECTRAVAAIRSATKKAELQQRIDVRKAKLDIERKPYDEAAEVKRQQENEEAAKKKANDADITSKALGYTRQSLKSEVNSLAAELDGVRYPTNDDYIKLGRLKAYIEVFKGTNDYNSMYSRYSSIESKFRNAKESYSSRFDDNDAEVTEEPTVSP